MDKRRWSLSSRRGCRPLHRRNHNVWNKALWVRRRPRNRGPDPRKGGGAQSHRIRNRLLPQNKTRNSIDKGRPKPVLPNKLPQLLPTLQLRHKQPRRNHLHLHGQTPPPLQKRNLLRIRILKPPNERPRLRNHRHRNPNLPRRRPRLRDRRGNPTRPQKPLRHPHGSRRLQKNEPRVHSRSNFHKVRHNPLPRHWHTDPHTERGVSQKGRHNRQRNPHRHSWLRRPKKNTSKTWKGKLQGAEVR